MGDKKCGGCFQARPTKMAVSTASLTASTTVVPAGNSLDDGEKAALALAASLTADLVLMDDREGVRVARNKGFRVLGTLGVLGLGARRGLLDLPTHSSGSSGRISATVRKSWMSCSMTNRPEIASS